MNSLDWTRTFGALAIAALCVTGYNAATGSYSGFGISLPIFDRHLSSADQHVKSGDQHLSSGGSSQGSAPLVNWRLQNAASITKRKAAASTGQASFPFDSNLGIARFAVTPDDQYLIGTDLSSGLSPPAVWRTSDGAALATLAGNDGGGLVPSYTEDGRAVMVGIVYETGTSGGSTARRRSLIVTDIITGEVIQTLSGPDTLTMPRGSCIQTVSSYAKVAVCVHEVGGATVSWDPLGGGVTAVWNVGQQRADASPVAIKDATLSADGSALAVLQIVDPNKHPLPPITIWNTANGTEIGRLQVSQPVEALALMANGRELLTVLRDGSVWLTTVATSASEKLAQLKLDTTVAPASAHFTVKSSLNDESVVATYSVYREDQGVTGLRSEPPQIIRVDMQSRKQIHYQSPFNRGTHVVGVVVPSREQWLVAMYGDGSVYKIFPHILTTF